MQHNEAFFLTIYLNNSEKRSSKNIIKKNKISIDQEISPSEKNCHAKTEAVKEKLSDNQTLIQKEHIVSRVSSCLPLGGQLVTQAELHMNRRCKQHKNQHQNIKQLEP